MDPYNLDDQDEREDFLQRYASDPDALAKALFPDHDAQARDWTDQLHAYAEVAQQAMQARLTGAIQQAQTLEARADGLYDALPDEARSW